MPTLQQRFQYMESQAAHIESRVRMIRHGTIQYPELVGISREASPHADVITYYSYDGTGQMTDIANWANDLPLIEVNQQQHNVDIHWSALAYGWSDRDIGRAMYTGTPLSDRLVRLAFRIAEEHKERVFLNGDSAKSWDGLLNHSSIPVQAASGVWDSANYLAIFKDINTLLSAGWSATNQVRISDTLLLPTTQYAQLQEPMGDAANRSIWEYVMANNVYTATTGRPLMIKTLRQLDGAGAGGVDRGLAYPRDMEVLRYHIPQELTFIEPQRVGLGWVYNGTLVLGGLEIMEPSAMRYLDGI